MSGAGVLTQPVTMGAALGLSKHNVIGAGHNIALPTYRVSARAVGQCNRRRSIRRPLSPVFCLRDFQTGAALAAFLAET